MQGRGSIAAPAPHPIPALTGSGLRFASDQFLLTIPITSSTIISPASLRSDPPDRNPRNSDRLPSGLLIALAGIRTGRTMDLIPQQIVVLNPEGGTNLSEPCLHLYTGLSLEQVRADEFRDSRIPCGDQHKRRRTRGVYRNFPDCST
jgi:hypothetical protein